MAKSKTPAELRPLYAAFGNYASSSASEKIPVSCTGEVYDENAKPAPFDYSEFQNYRNLKSRLELLNRCIQIKSGDVVTIDPPPQNYTDRELRKDLRTEFGPLDITCKHYERMFQTYKKARRHQLEGWLNEEKRLMETGSVVAYKEMAKTTENEISFILEKYPAFQDLRNAFFSTKLDWFRLPRVNYLRIDPLSPYAIEAISEGWTVLKIKGSQSHVALLPPKRKNTVINLHLCDLSSSFPSLIIAPGISDDQAQKFKSIIQKFPHGVVFSKYMEVYAKFFGIAFKPTEEAFMKMCEELPDIFLVVEGIDPEKKLIFPAFWRGIMKPTLYLRTKLWHWVKFIINNNGGTIDAGLVIQKIKYIFNLEIRPKDWGFVRDEHFVHFLIHKVSPQPTFFMYKLGTPGKDDKFMVSNSIKMEEVKKRYKLRDRRTEEKNSQNLD